MTQDLTKELVRVLRGKRSQAPLSRRLGFGTNVLYLWESGRRAPVALSVVALAKSAGVDVEQRLGAFMGKDASRPLPLTSREDLGRLLCRLRGEFGIQELAAALSTDRTTLSRWLSGKTEPAFWQLLRLVEVTTHRLFDFVSVFVDPARLPSARKDYVALTAQRSLAYEDPWTHAVLRALELSRRPAPFQSQVEFLAERTGLECAQVEQALKRLRQARQIRRVGGRFQVRAALPVDTRTDPEANLKLKKHWLSVVEQRLERSKARGEGLYSYNLFAVSDAGFERIRKLHFDYFERLRNIVEEERGGDRVVVASLQLVPLEE
jgi:transcriptional regulator with XRE-family HTH domain